MGSTPMASLRHMEKAGRGTAIRNVAPAVSTPNDQSSAFILITHRTILPMPRDFLALLFPPKQIPISRSLVTSSHCGTDLCQWHIRTIAAALCSSPCSGGPAVAASAVQSSVNVDPEDVYPISGSNSVSSEIEFQECKHRPKRRPFSFPI